MMKKADEKKKDGPEMLASIGEEGEEDQVVAKEAEDSLEIRTPSKRKPESQQKGRKEKKRKLESLIGWGEGSSHQEEDDEGQMGQDESKDLRMETKPAEKKRIQTKLSIDIGGSSASEEEDQPFLVYDKEDPLPGGWNSLPRL